MNTESPSLTRLRPLALLAAAFVALFGLSLPASAAVEATFSELGPGYSEVISGEDAGSIMMSVNGQTVKAFCVQMNVEFNPGATFTVVPQSEAGVSGLAAAAWIARNHGSTGTPLADPASEDAAAQVAIWSFTDGATVDDTTVLSPSIRARALELIAAAGSLSNGAVDYTIEVTGSVVDGVVVASASVATSGGAPVEGAEVSFNFAGGSSQVGTTDSSGVATVEGPEVASLEGVSVEVSASATLGVSAGAALVPNDSSQILILAQGFNTTVSDSDDIALSTTTETTSTTQAPSTTEAPVVATTAPTQVINEELPRTGGESSTVLLVAGAGLVLAALAGLAYRRSRTDNS